MRFCLCLIATALLVGNVRATDDTPRLRQLLTGGVVTIPPGDYFVNGTKPIPIASHTTVFANGARFHLPEQLGDKARLVVFAGTNVAKFTWHGGEFLGHVFDPARCENTWEPNVNTRIFDIITTPGGMTADILFRDVCFDGVAGAVIHVNDASKRGSESEVDTFAERVTVENCTLLRSGKFMWDYGCLWQQIVWPEDYEPWGVDAPGVTSATISSATPDSWTASRAGSVFSAARCQRTSSVSPDLEVPPGAIGPGVKVIHNLRAAFNGLYSPTGSGTGKGGVHSQCRRDVRISGRPA